MTDAAQFDLKKLTERLEAAARNAAVPDSVSLEWMTTFGTEAARMSAKAATDAALQSLKTDTAAAAEPAAPPVPPPTIRDLKEGLRAAVQLEFATIPLYLTALWSIIDQPHPVAKSIRAVVHEEMLHLSLLCNMLSALGERPILTGAIVPRFPSRMPGGVHPEIELRLEGYGPGALATFMEIERPELAIQIDDDPLENFPAEDQTIGRFYTALLEVFKKVNPTLDSKWQIAGPFAWFVMSKLEHVEEALTLIMAQGEGARGIPYVRYPKYLSHYYRFKSLVMLTELKWNDQNRKLERGKPIPPPPIFTLAPASPDGYGLAAPRELRAASDKFETTYSQMLRLLEGSWLEGGDKSFVKALELMFDLGSLAQAMMHIATPDGRGYCPSFRYRS